MFNKDFQARERKFDTENKLGSPPIMFPSKHDFNCFAQLKYGCECFKLNIPMMFCG